MTGRRPSGFAGSVRRMAGRTQTALYREIDLDLSWSEDALPQADRTKHVHGLHPYLGKFVPQLAEAFLRRCFAPGQRVLDPFMGSGTTLVEASVLGHGRDRHRHLGLQLPARPGEDRRRIARRDRAGAARDAGAGLAHRPGRRAGHPVARALVRTRGAARPARLPRRRRRARRPGRRCRRHRPLPRRPLGARDHPLRPRLPPPARDRRVLVPQAPPHLPAGRGGRQVPAPLHGRHRGAAARLRRRAGRRHGAHRPRRRPRRRAPGAGGRDPHLTAVPGADRLPRAAPLRLRAARPDRPAGGGDRRGRAGRSLRAQRRLRRVDRRDASPRRRPRCRRTPPS